MGTYGTRQLLFPGIRRTFQIFYMYLDVFPPSTRQLEAPDYPATFLCSLHKFLWAPIM
jgi:hypothetical protein